MSINFGKTAHDYKTYRQGFPPPFFDRLMQMGIIGTGKRALDIGTGTGTVARGMALAGCAVTGADIALELIQQAKVLDAEAGVQIEYVIAPAETTGLPDASFDVVTAGQCWHWFNRPRAAAEVHRLLADGGAVVIAHLDWIPFAGNLLEATEALMMKYNPAWQFGGGMGMYPAWLTDLSGAGFTALETFSFDLHLHYTHEAWRGRVRASAAISASNLSEAQIRAFDDELKATLATQFPQDPLAVHHRVWAVIGRKG